MSSVTILDGAMGTELIARGVNLEGETWSARALFEAPHIIGKVHRAYAEAGAMLHTANTFRTQARQLDAWERAARTAVDLARAAVPAMHRVAGSMAPVADCYRPELSPGEQSRDDHRALAKVLAEAGCDLLLCETFPARVEALVAVEEALRTGLPAWLSLTAGPDADLMSPAEMAAVAHEAVALGTSRVLVNCIGAAKIRPFVQALSESGLPFGVYANAGGRNEGYGWNQEGAADRYAELAVEWHTRGRRDWRLLRNKPGAYPRHTSASRCLAFARKG